MTEDIKFFQTDNLEAALELLVESSGVIKPVAVGTDLMVKIREDRELLQQFAGILDITNISELQGIAQEQDFVRIGALVTHREIIESELLQEKYPALVDAARAIGSTPIRNRATIGGNVCNAAACADTLGPLVAFEAEVVLASQAGERVVPVADLVEEPYQTIIRQDELLRHFRLPLPAEGTFSSFQKIGRRQAAAITRISLVLAARVSQGKVEHIKIVPGSAIPVPEPLTALEKRIKGQKIGEIDSRELSALAGEEMVKITGERWSTPYKKPALTTLVRRALVELKEVAENE